MEMVPFFMFEYIEIRYHMEVKRLKNEIRQKLKEGQDKLRKLSKVSFRLQLFSTYNV
jgi:hypothetical protein